MDLSQNPSSSGRKRKLITLEEKMDLINLHEGGMSVAKISRDSMMPESSIRRIIKSKDQYKTQSQNGVLALSKDAKKIEDLNHKNYPVSLLETQLKALPNSPTLPTSFTQLETQLESLPRSLCER